MQDQKIDMMLYSCGTSANRVIPDQHLTAVRLQKLHIHTPSPPREHRRGPEQQLLAASNVSSPFELG